MAKTGVKKDSAEPSTTDARGEATESETAQVSLDVATSVVADPPDAANDQAMVVHMPEVQTAITAVTQEIDEAVAAIELGAEQLDLKPIKATDEAARPNGGRKRLTPLQGAQLAQRRLIMGEKLLRKEAIGVAHVKVDVTIKHSKLANLFKRAYPMCDQGLYTIIRHGGDNLGNAETGKVLAMIETMTDELRATANETYTVALSMVTEAKKKKSSDTDLGFVPLSYIPAFDGAVTARSPLANQLLHCYKVIDSAMCELENLHWSGVRKYNEIELEFNAVKTKVNRIADLVRRTIYGIRKKHDEVFGVTPRVPREAAPASA